MGFLPFRGQIVIEKVYQFFLPNKATIEYCLMRLYALCGNLEPVRGILKAVFAALLGL
jgi:hypothetical protein